MTDESEAVVPQGSAFPEYVDQMSTVPDELDLRDYLKMLTVLSREAGGRVAHGDGHEFRKAVFDAVDESGELVSKLAEAYECADTAMFRKLAGALSANLTSLSKLSEEGISDIAESSRFFTMTERVCKRVEKMEELKTNRMSVLDRRTVFKLIDNIPVVLDKHLSQERAREAFAEIMDGFKE